MSRFKESKTLRCEAMRQHSVMFLLVCVLLVFAFPLGEALAQRANAYSTLENLTTEEKIREFRDLGTQEKMEIFGRLSRAERQALFEKLSDEEKLEVFGTLDDAEKKSLFASLEDEEKVKFFSNLEEEDRVLVFKDLNDADKRIVFESLSDEEKSALLEKYPLLKSILPPERLPVAVPEKPAVPPEKPEPSRIEKILSGDFPTDVERELLQFGYDFFDKEVTTFAPVGNVPVGPDYIIGPGDRFTIHLWGKAEKTHNVTVTRDGNIVVPRLGSLTVSGLSFAELRRFLENKFREYYPDFEMSITMGRLRTIDVFIVGEVKSPGTYTVSSLSTVITALYAAGGPSKNGSLREIQVVRNGKTASRLDLYDFFTKGIKKNDIRLQPADTIFVPVLGPVVGIAGNVRRPAIYELKGGQTIGEVIQLAGGALPTGHLQNVVLERIIGNQRRVIKSFNLDPSYRGINQNLKAGLNDGDVVKIYPVHEEMRQVVYLEGHVKHPREYELKKGLRLSDLIRSYDDLLPEPYLPRAEIIRLAQPDFHPEVVEFNLGALLEREEKEDLLLQELDRVMIYGAKEKEEIPEVNIKGAVRRPGTYRLYKGMKVKDLIFQAGNLAPGAYMEKASLSRVITGEEATEVVKISFSPAKAIEGLGSDNIPLEMNDVIHIREIPEYSRALERKVYLEGEFLFPGEYTFSEGERLDSVIDRAGGLTEEAYPLGAVYLRESVKEVQRIRLKDYVSGLEEDILTLSARAAEGALDETEAAILEKTLNAKKQLLEKLKTAEPTGRMVINLPEALSIPNSPSNIELRPGDRLIVQKRSDTVNVLGEVFNPTALLFEKDKTVAFYLDRVGGPTDNAEKKEIYVVRADGSVFSKSQEGFMGVSTWDYENQRWQVGRFESMKLNPGDTVIVPKKVERYPWLRVVKDVTQILYQIAVAAGVIIVAY